ncbi:MAG TPA: hypothetical protein VIJ27_06150 [Mucilaginibacter sp.]
MRISLNEIKLIDDHIFNQGTHEDALLLDALLILNPALSNQIRWQKKAHTIIKQYGRKKLKAEIESVHRKLFHEPIHQSFRLRILRLFRPG